MECIMILHNVDQKLHNKLRDSAMLHGCSVEDEVCNILRTTLLHNDNNSGDVLVEAIRKKLQPLGGIELELPSRDACRTPIDFRI